MVRNSHVGIGVFGLEVLRLGLGSYSSGVWEFLSRSSFVIHEGLRRRRDVQGSRLLAWIFKLLKTRASAIRMEVPGYALRNSI